MRIAALSLLALLGSPAAATEGLTIKAGESWMFAISGGQPMRARKVNSAAKVPRGQVVVTVRSMMGTSMSIRSNNQQTFTYKAELIGTVKPVPVRSCTLPANGKVSFEHWPQKAKAVRLSDFKIAAKDGSCP